MRPSATIAPSLAILELHKAHTNATTHMRLLSMRERPDTDTDTDTNTDTAADIDTQITIKKKRQKWPGIEVSEHAEQEAEQDAERCVGTNKGVTKRKRVKNSAKFNKKMRKIDCETFKKFKFARNSTSVLYKNT